jgi:hypothetical protein
MQIASGFFKNKMAILALAIAFTGCSLPANWDKQIPGAYAGSNGQLTEEISFEPSGSYIHNLRRGTNVIHTEKGQWKPSHDKFEINLEPSKSGEFTQFYDPMTDVLSTNGKPFIDYVYFVAIRGDGFDEISASVDDKFTLKRIEK